MNCFIKKELFGKVGGFDEEYGIGYYEDVDLCLKLRKIGLKIYYCSSSLIYHNEHTSTTSRRRGSLFKKNKNIFIKKWKDFLDKEYRS